MGASHTQEIIARPLQDSQARPLDAIYERGRYREDIDYAQPLTPPLSVEQAAWLAEQLRGENPAPQPTPRRGRRKGG